MSTGCQKDKKTDRQTDRKTDRRQKDFSAQLSKQKLLRMSTGCQKDRQTDSQTDRKTFQLSYQNKSYSKCQQDVRKIEI